MCGRTCMTLNPEEVVCACKYKKDEEVIKPTYRNEFNLSKKYKPSYNLSPSLISPIIISSKHFDSDADSSERTIIPALWSLIPRWHKGDYRKHGLTTNNARIEGIENSKLYKPLLSSGKRCVMIVEGFYEWQTVDTKLKSSERPVYYIYMPQPDEKIKIEDKSTWNKCDHIKLLHVAGLFDIWHDEKGDSIYSFTIITFESDEHFSWLHHRTPAILETEEQICDWLDYERIPHDKALDVIKKPKLIIWHEVTHAVNNSRNQSDLCNKSKQQAQSSKGSIMSWIKKGKESPENSPKRFKKE